MYERILVPLDGSNRAERALYHAEGMAQRFSSRIVLIRVVEARIETEIADRARDSTTLRLSEFRRRAREAEEYLENTRRLLERRGIDTVTRLAYGDVVNAIIGAAQEFQVGLIVIASHGRSGVERVFYGSVSAAVLQLIDRPMLVIRARRDSHANGVAEWH